MRPLSPTGVSLFEQDKDAFYLKYLAKQKPPRSKQTQPMAVGSAFDAYVKSFLYGKLVGYDDKYQREALFESQVESHNRDWAKDAGEHCFLFYRDCGALDQILRELRGGIGKPRFEFEISGEIEGVPLLGKPDIFFMSKEGSRVVYDWKINGYCARNPVSPMRGYLRLFPGNKQHKDCAPMVVRGVEINVAEYLEDLNPDWARQLAIYAWLLGEPVGSQMVIAGIDQIACKPDNVKPALRVANHRLRISEEYQLGLLDRIKQIWAQVNSGHFFSEMTLEESQGRCQMLEDQAETLASDPEFDALLR